MSSGTDVVGGGSGGGNNDAGFGGSAAPSIGHSSYKPWTEFSFDSSDRFGVNPQPDDNAFNSLGFRV